MARTHSLLGAVKAHVADDEARIMTFDALYMIVSDEE